MPQLQLETKGFVARSPPRPVKKSDSPDPGLLFDKVYPVNEIVRVDYFIPGCPPSADAIWKYLNDLILGRIPRLDHNLVHYD